MSHTVLRQEKNCLNCGTEVPDRYCPHCGQKNVEISHSAIHMVIHYVQDLFHYDGKLWHTIKNLILKSGEIPKEFIEGKRARNLEPVKFYVLASTIFFLILFYLAGKDSLSLKTKSEFNYQKRMYHLKQEKEFLSGTPDTVYIIPLIKTLQSTMDSVNGLESDSNNTTEIDIFGSTLDTIPKSGFGKFIYERVRDRTKELEESHEGDEAAAATTFINEVFHRLPQLFFLSMPFFALFLKIMYIRRHRPYADHFIFSIYQYSYFYFIIGAFLLIDHGLSEISWFKPVNGYLIAVFVTYLFVYLAFSLRRFYQDRWIKLIFRYALLMGLMFFLILILFILIAMIAYLF